VLTFRLSCRLTSAAEDRSVGRYSQRDWAFKIHVIILRYGFDTHSSVNLHPEIDRALLD